jgi:nucleoside 2-deoxyribosyltransferase
MQANRCFLSTPISGEFTEVRQAIAEALERTGVEPILVEKFTASPRGATEMMLDEIRTATFVIADVTANNPWVLYEVGLAHGMQKPVFLITQDTESVPQPLKYHFLFFYSIQDLTRLKEAVVSWTRRFFSRNLEKA